MTKSANGNMMTRSLNWCLSKKIVNCYELLKTETDFYTSFDTSKYCIFTRCKLKLQYLLIQELTYVGYQQSM